MKIIAAQFSWLSTLESHAKWRPNKFAVILNNKPITYAELFTRLEAFAKALLTHGLKTGDKVATRLSTSSQGIESMWGAVLAGGITVPLSTGLPAHTAEKLVDDAEARFIVGAAKFLSGMSYCPENFFDQASENDIFVVDLEHKKAHLFSNFVQSADDVKLPRAIPPSFDFNIMYSSGTTGTPKGIVHSHAARYFFATDFAQVHQYTDTSVGMVTIPLYSNASWAVILPTLYAGGTAVLMEKWNAKEFIQLSQAYGGTHTFMVPTQYQDLLKCLEGNRLDATSMRHWICGGAPVSADLRKTILEKLPGYFLELYGTTEGVGTILQPGDITPERCHPSVGKTYPGSDIKIIDKYGKELPDSETGEIVGRTKIMMTHYHNRPDATEDIIWSDDAGNDYLRTGDLGFIDGEGFLYIHGRKKDMIISGGVNVFPSDIEEIIEQHPLVKEAAVIGEADERWGERPVAFVALEDPSLSTDEILTWSENYLANYQRLAKITVVDLLPRNSMGKMMKHKLTSR